MLADRVVFGSTHFRILIVVKHVPTSLRYALDVLVRCDGDTVDVLQWRRVS